MNNRPASNISMKPQQLPVMETEHIILVFELIAILWLLIAVMLTDDPLNPEAEAWLEIANNTEDVEGNGYYYLLGIAAEASDDPEVFGRQQLAAYREAEAAMLSDSSSSPALLSNKPAGLSLKTPLPLPPISADGVYCDIDQDGCLQWLLNNPDAIRHELEAARVILARYREFLQFQTLKTLTKPSLYEMSPPYLYISRGNKLLQLQIILNVAEDERIQAVNVLLDSIKHQRKHLEATDSQLYKMYVLAMLAENLELLINVYEPSTGIPAFEFLTHEERSMRHPMVREFGMAANLSESMNQDFMSLGETSPLAPLLFRLAFKPQMSINTAFEKYRAIYALSVLPPHEYNPKTDQVSPENKLMLSLRNIFGRTFLSIATMTLYTDYIDRINNVDRRIALVNALLPLSQTQWVEAIKDPSTLPPILDPYNPGQSAYIDAENQALCFNSTERENPKNLCVKKYTTQNRQT